ncbi:helix-turn-helix domain-containing protein [Umezawaea sp. Da 62-37]|uniref:winged helix-turn-helix transcriptional regulator n=1 Tax=Umezawaea sp. Da 62-37 TaxID=3075927 RepID=UPI0028F73644|nr:helix-turn-helix domain-containing protein [Umezawaea sp. Da 62-37]WNV85087.1 helix-turn-helix domain-containing protein [Umezawaea sp. Da 62-37]
MQPIESERADVTSCDAPGPQAGPPPNGWSDPPCPVARAVNLIGDQWILLILRDALDGTRMFNAFQRNLGVAKNILSDRLRKLVEHGVLVRRTAPSGKRQEYVLTDSGRQLFTVIVALRQWGEAHAFDAGEPRSVLVDNNTGTPVPALHLKRADGVTLDAGNTHVERVE